MLREAYASRSPFLAVVWRTHLGYYCRMGLYDREYTYEDREPGFHLGGPQSVTTKLVFVTVGVYLLQLFIEGFSAQFALPSNWFREPWQFYRLLSYGFLHDTRTIQHILFNMIVLWMFGQEVERRYGTREYLTFYLTAIVFAGLVWSLIEQTTGRPGVMVGASGGISGLFALYALNFPHARVLFMFIIPMPMWVAALIMIALDAYGAVVRTSPIAFTAHLAGALYGLIYYRTGWNPAMNLVELFGGSNRKKKPKLRVIEPEDENDETEVEVDRLLRKIQEQGQDSLTWSERRTLEKASREYQNRRR